jgi:tetratricopeptide (TPR) repeat protein
MENKAQDDDLVMNLVELALGQPEQERRAYLQRACTGETELFEQAWEYVQWESRMQGFLLEPLYSPPVNEHPFEAGELLDGRFRILREIAQGGMGVVYEAMDERLDRRIAIKCAKTGFRKRLPPEVRHAREISHPNVCKIFEIHTTRTSAGEMDFVTMEYLEGETLADRLKRGPLPEAEARAIARQLCSGLAEAHGQGVIHGDLKSNNVILTKVADASTRSVITDFGMSRATETAQSTLQSGPRGGTPDYMAPELLQGEKASVASDVYALGVMLHELVSGRKPAAGAAIAVHPKWNSIVAKCLAADPKHRYANATQIAQAFEPPRTRRWFLMAAAAVLVATITGVVTYQRATAPKEVVRLAMLPFTYGADLAPVAEGVFRDASANLAKIRGGTKVRYSAVPLAEIQRAKVQTPEQAKSGFGATHVLHGTLTPEHDRVVLHVLLTDTRTGVNTKDWKIDYAPGQERYIPVALAGFATGALHLPTLAIPAMNSAAERDYQSGSNLLRRDSTIDAALSAFERAQAADPDSALVYAGLAEAQWLKYGLTRGGDWLARATESTKQAQRRNPDLPRVLYVAGTLDFVNSLYELAAAEYQRALELDPKYSDVHRFLGRVYELSGQTEMALAAHRNAIQNDPDNYRAYVFLGWFYNDTDQFSQALAPLRQAVVLAPDEPDARNQLGFAYKSLGQFQAAEGELRKALQYGESVFVLNQLGETLMYERREQDAIPIFKRTFAIDPNEYLALMDLSICYRRLNLRQEWDQANRRGLQAAEAAKRLNPRRGDTRAILAYFHSQLGQPQAAESEISQALTFSPDGVGVRWIASLTYEALAKRESTLAVLSSASPELLADVNRWPDLAGLQSDPRFIQLLISNRVQ